MVTDELLPLLHDRGLDTSRIALLGWSMGGYGALLVAGRLGSARVAACVAESPALWLHPGDTAPGAFDDPADYETHNVFGRQRQLDGIAVRVDCGLGDGFLPAAQRYVRGFGQRPAGGFEPGGHTLGYWRRMAPAQLAFHPRPPLRTGQHTVASARALTSTAARVYTSHASYHDSRSRRHPSRDRARPRHPAPHRCSGARRGVLHLRI